jgi:hypothetical protein
MKDKQPRQRKGATRARRVPDGDRSEETAVTRDRDASSEYHDTGRLGGLPDLDKKTETEAEHDSWGRHG